MQSAHLLINEIDLVEFPPCSHGSLAVSIRSCSPCGMRRLVDLSTLHCLCCPSQHSWTPILLDSNWYLTIFHPLYFSLSHKSATGNLSALFDPDGWDFHKTLEESYGQVVKLLGVLGVSDHLALE